MDEDIYNILPITNLSRQVDVPGNNNSENVTMWIWDANDSAAQKFKIIDDGNGTGSFKILTGTSNYEKCITVANESTAESALLVQKTYANNGTSDSDHWYLEKYDSLNVYDEKRCDIGRYSFNAFNINFNQGRQFVNYVIDTTGSADTVIELYENGNITQYVNDDYDYPYAGRNSKIVFSPSLFGNYQIRVKLYGSAKGNCRVRFYPEKDVFFNSYTGSSGDINTMVDIDNTLYLLNSMGYYVNHIDNCDKSFMLTDTQNSTSKFNNDYYFISSHGSQGPNGYINLNPDTTSSYYIYPSDLPNMSNVKFAVFAICHGGAAGNAADVAVNIKHAQAALGWPGLTYTHTSLIFTTKLWENISSGMEIQDSISNARSHTSVVFFWESIFGWGEDTIMDPTLYTLGGGSTVINSMQASDNTLGGSTVNSSLQMSQDYCDKYPERFKVSNQQELKKDLSKDTFIAYYDEYTGITKYVRQINGILTNEWYATTPNGKVYKSANSFSDNDLAYINRKLSTTVTNRISVEKAIISDGIEFGNQRTVLENTFYLKAKGQITAVRRVQSCYTNAEGFKYLTEKYFDLSTGKEINIDFIQNNF